MLSTLHPWSHLNLDFSLQGRPLITNPFYLIDIWMGFPGGAVGKESACQSRRHKRQRFVPWVRKMPWRRKWQLAPVFLSREFHRGAWQATVHGATKCQRLLRAHTHNRYAAAAKSLQSCPTLCDPIDGSLPGSPVPGILQARTLEWVAISFSNAGKWKGKVKSLCRVRPSATPWTEHLVISNESMKLQDSRLFTANWP